MKINNNKYNLNNISNRDSSSNSNNDSNGNSQKLKANKIIIAIDCDDVLISFMPEFEEYVNKKYGYKIQHTNDDSDLWDSWGISKEKALEILAEFYNSNEFVNLPPIKGAKEVLEEFKDKFEYHVVSSRFESTRINTIKSIKINYGNLIDEHHVHLKPKNGYDEFKTHGTHKALVCKKIKARLLIDDHFQKVLDVKNQIPEQEVLCLEQKWSFHDKQTEIPIAHSWNDSTKGNTVREFLKRLLEN